MVLGERLPEMLPVPLPDSDGDSDTLGEVDRDFDDAGERVTNDTNELRNTHTMTPM